MQLPVFIRGASRIVDLALRLRFPRTLCLMAAAVCFCSALALAQTGGSNGNKVTPGRITPGTISGKVTMAGKPAAGIKVILIAENPSLHGRASDNPAARTQTDQSGLYSFTGLSPAQYWVFPVAPAAVFQGDAIRSEEGKSVLLDTGEEASAVDLNLVPGGVITGRVVDAANQPVSGEEIALERVDASGRVLQSGRITFFYITTDDRGIYRAFRLPAGRYRVS
ncbi:MAG: MSCRAMM family protein, partial [Blastocatellia bacterium]